MTSPRTQDAGHHPAFFTTFVGNPNLNLYLPRLHPGFLGVRSNIWASKGPIRRHFHGALVTAICLGNLGSPRARNQNSPVNKGVVEIKIGNKYLKIRGLVILEPLYVRLIIRMYSPTRTTVVQLPPDCKSNMYLRKARVSKGKNTWLGRVPAASVPYILLPDLLPSTDMLPSSIHTYMHDIYLYVYVYIYMIVYAYIILVLVTTCYIRKSTAKKHLSHLEPQGFYPPWIKAATEVSCCKMPNMV